MDKKREAGPVSPEKRSALPLIFPSLLIFLRPLAKPATDRVIVERGNHDRLLEKVQWFGTIPMPRLPSRGAFGAGQIPERCESFALNIRRGPSVPKEFRRNVCTLAVETNKNGD
jgi:hypothetical protein